MKLGIRIGWFLLTSVISFLSFRVDAQTDRPRQERDAPLPSDATRCDVSIPLHIELIPLNEPEVGKAARFRVKVDSRLDPDLVEDMRLQYELPPQLKLEGGTPSVPALLLGSGISEFELGVVIPDESRYAIRARVVAHLSNGQTIGQTAVRWVDVGDEEPPEGAIGRIVNRDLTGIRLYQGVTIRN